jgi:hypothetical protein
MQQLPDHLSYSSISCYLQCPLKWRFHYVDKLPEEFITSSLVFGQAIHESVAAFLNASLSGDNLTPDEMLMVYLNSWRESKDVEIRCSNGDSEEKLLKKAQDLLGLGHGSQDGLTEVLGVEEEFSVDLAALTDYPSLDLPPLIGYVDHIIRPKDWLKVQHPRQQIETKGLFQKCSRCWLSSDSSKAILVVSLKTFLKSLKSVRSISHERTSKGSSIWRPHG